METRTSRRRDDAGDHSRFLRLRFVTDELFARFHLDFTRSLGFVETDGRKDSATFALSGMEALLTSYCPEKALPMANFIRYFLSTISFLGLW